MYTLGIDVGSSSSKAVILEDGKKIVAHAVVEIGTGSTGPERVLDEVFKDTNLKIEDMGEYHRHRLWPFQCRLRQGRSQRNHVPCQRGPL